MIKNDPVVNEISEDDVNDLSDQIRQLKVSLSSAKSHFLFVVWIDRQIMSPSSDVDDQPNDQACIMLITGGAYKGKI